MDDLKTGFTRVHPTSETWHSQNCTSPTSFFLGEAAHDRTSYGHFKVQWLHEENYGFEALFHLRKSYRKNGLQLVAVDIGKKGQERVISPMVLLWHCMVTDASYRSGNNGVM